MPNPFVKAAMEYLRRKIEDWLFPLRMKFGRKIIDDDQRKMVRVSPTELIKGPCRSQELEAMLYIAAHAGSKLSAPKVHRTYQRKDGLYIAMDFVPGARLDRIWHKLLEHDQRDTVERIWDYVRSFRALPAPDIAVSSIRGGSALDGAIGQEEVGPFAHLNNFAEIMQSRPALEEFKRF